ncbi:PREDICTED: melanoma inhibitory activity protein 2 [Propithecus coquereli]|uniref:melanoma inhibitory activity protein 2 n=1 Tax=Propithecus coquereli TaxID=379532 RepID=UPI00063F80C1|nr:PREDICTED: melanoma inhibitory activity protein 2 [Propithecus coquereli]
MAELEVHRILLLVISLTKCLEGTKLLADLKKCGDLECETLMSRVSATRDYRGPDCRYLNFTKGEEISVYVKLAGEREDLWAGSKGKDFGYFPRDAVQLEEVFISEEVQISTKESDFLCLLGASYTFENEDSELNSDNGENIYTYEENKDQKFSKYENDFQIESGFYATSGSTLFEDQFPASEAPEDIRSTSESKDWEEVEAERVEQDHIPEEDHVPPSSAVPEVTGWFGLGSEQAEEKAFESVIEPVQESSFHSRKIAVEDKNDLEELNNGMHQTEQKKEPGSELDSVPKKQSELASESEHILKPQATGWFGGGFTSYLGFGDEDTELELLSKESNPPLQDVPNSISSDEEGFGDEDTELELLSKEGNPLLQDVPNSMSSDEEGFGDEDTELELLSKESNPPLQDVPNSISSDEEGFGDEDTELELLSKEGNPPLQDVPNSISSDEEATVPCTEILTEKPDIITNDSSILKPSWFDFGFRILGFAYANEDKIISDDGKNKEDGGGDKREYPTASEFDPYKEQEIQMIKIMETEDQIDKKRVLEKTDDSDTLPYLKKFLYNPWSFQNIPKETELSFPAQTLDQNNVVENDETEEFSTENYPIDNMKVMMLESSYSESDMVSKIESPVRIHEEVHFKTPSSKNNYEKSKPSVDTEGPAQVEIDRSLENTLLNSQMVSPDNPSSTRNYIPQKEDASEFQIMKYLFQIDVYDFLNSAFSPIVVLTERVSWPF